MFLFDGAAIVLCRTCTSCAMSALQNCGKSNSSGAGPGTALSLVLLGGGREGAAVAVDGRRWGLVTTTTDTTGRRGLRYAFALMGWLTVCVAKRDAPLETGHSVRTPPNNIRAYRPRPPPTGRPISGKKPSSCPVNQKKLQSSSFKENSSNPHDPCPRSQNPSYNPPPCKNSCERLHTPDSKPHFSPPSFRGTQCSASRPRSPNNPGTRSVWFRACVSTEQRPDDKRDAQHHRRPDPATVDDVRCGRTRTTRLSSMVTRETSRPDRAILTLRSGVRTVRTPWYAPGAAREGRQQTRQS